MVVPHELDGNLVTLVASADDLAGSGGAVLEELALAVESPMPWNPSLLLPLNKLKTFIPCPLTKTDQLPGYCNVQYMDCPANAPSTKESYM